LRTPVTIARGHLEVLQRVNGSGTQEIEIALDELGRIENILERLLLLAKSKQPDFVVPAEIDVEHFLEDIFLRWSEVVPRGWRLGGLEQERCSPTRKDCGSRSTPCSRTPSSTPNPSTRSASPAAPTGATW
jgi:Signal transduction histidine kinase